MTEAGSDNVGAIGLIEVANPIVPPDAGALASRELGIGSSRGGRA
jgi:hypothetical protein